MQIDAQLLRDTLAQLRQDEDKALGQINQIMGAIKQVEHLLRLLEVDAPSDASAVYE